MYTMGTLHIPTAGEHGGIINAGQVSLPGGSVVVSSGCVKVPTPHSATVFHGLVQFPSEPVNCGLTITPPISSVLSQPQLSMTTHQHCDVTGSAAGTLVQAGLPAISVTSSATIFGSTGVPVTQGLIGRVADINEDWITVSPQIPVECSAFDEMGVVSTKLVGSGVTVMSLLRAYHRAVLITVSHWRETVIGITGWLAGGTLLSLVLQQIERTHAVLAAIINNARSWRSWARFLRQESVSQYSAARRSAEILNQQVGRPQIPTALFSRLVDFRVDSLAIADV